MGFFDSVDIELTNQCSSCTGRTACKHPCLDNYKGTNDILLLFGAPTKFEDETGIPFQDNIMDWYKEKFDAIGIDFNACSKAHITGCYAKDNKALTKYQKKCDNRVVDFIKEVKPKLIIAFGSDTLNTTVSKDYTRDVSNSVRWRGFLMPYRAYGFPTWLMTTFDFSEVCLQDCFTNIIKNKEAKEHKLITTPKEIEETVSFHSSYKIAHRLFLTDIRKAVIGYKKPIPEDPANSVPIHVLKDKKEVVHYLKETYNYLKANPNAILTLDTETNSLKCYDSNKRIYCMAMYADPSLGCFGFPLHLCYMNTEFNRYDPNIPEADPDIVAELKHIAELNPRICGCNYKYDLVWLSVKLGVKLERCVWDTMVVAHLLDPRDGVTSLKFCAYTYFGSVWETEAHEYLKSSEEDKDEYGTNAVNNIFSAPYSIICRYNCIDVINTYYVMKEQYKQWLEFPNPNKWFAFKLFHKVIPVLAHMEMNGILIDMNKVEAGRKQCQDELKKIEERIKDDPVWIKWGEIVGVEKRSILSASQIIDVFINHMHLHPHGISMKEKAKADLEWLSKLVDQEPFIANILNYRKYTKILHTYLDGIAKEVNDDGRLRCFYTTNNVSSYRIAANSPNFMNMSSRDEFQVELIKKCFIPDENCVYSGYDFTALENYGSASLSEDPYFLKVLEGSADLHKDNSLFLFFMTDEEFKALKKYDEEHGTHYAKTNRNGGKIASFSTLYGATKQTIGGSVYKYLNEKQVRVTPTEFARDRVIKMLKMDERFETSNATDKEEFYLDCFIEHADDFYKDFWNVRMKESKRYRDKLLDTYLTNGEIFYPTGNVFKGMFSSLTILNAICQGSSGEVCLAVIVWLDYLFDYFKIPARITNIIHDSVYLCTPKEYQIKALALQKYVMEEVTYKAFNKLGFLKLHLKAEPEVSDISWGDAKDYDDPTFIEYYKENKEKIGRAVDKALNGDYTFETWR